MYGIGALPDDFLLYSGDDELMGSGSDPLSIRLNNPGAIAKSAFRWEGASADQPPGRFIAFDTPEDGIRAMARNLDAYGSKYGLNTVAGIVNRWAPPSENDTRQYAATVAKAIGVDPNQPLNLDDPRLKAKLMTAMARVEAGRDHYTEDQMLNAIGGGKGTPMQPPMQPEYDVEQGLSNIDQMGQRVAQMGGVSQMPAPPQRVGLSGLDPYLKIAAQLMPERQGSGWGDALINAGAAMMQSRSPDFLGAAGAGLQAGNQALQARRGQDRQDVMDRFKFGMGLAQFDQKDAGEWAVNDGVMYNKKTGETRDVPAGLKPFTEAAKLRADLAAGRIKQEDFDAGMAKIRGEGESPIERVIREMGIDPRSPQAQELRMEYAKRMGGTQVNVNNTPETEFGKKLAGIKADVVEGARTGATSAMQTLEAVNRMSSVMNEGLKTGTFAPARDAFARFALDVGVPQTAVDQFFNTKDAKVFEAAAKEMVLGIVKTLGPNPSNADREFIEKTLPNLRDPTEAVKAVLDYMQIRAQKKLRYFDDLYSHVGGGGDPLKFEVDYLRKNASEAPWKSAPSAPKTEAQPGTSAPAPARTQAAPPAGREPSNSFPPPNQILQMDRAAIDALTPNVSQMTDDQLRALHARRRQLLGIVPDGQTGTTGAP